MPPVAVGLSLRVFERPDKSRPFGFQSTDDANAGRQDLADITVAPRGHRFGRELLQIRRQGDAVHEAIIGQGRGAGKDFAGLAARAIGKDASHG